MHIDLHGLHAWHGSVILGLLLITEPLLDPKLTEAAVLSGRRISVTTCMPLRLCCGDLVILQ